MLDLVLAAWLCIPIENEAKFECEKYMVTCLKYNKQPQEYCTLAKFKETEEYLLLE